MDDRRDILERMHLGVATLRVSDWLAQNKHLFNNNIYKAIFLHMNVAKPANR